MIVHRCFAWSVRARLHEQDGALWVPRAFQGEGRHDNPDVYGCLYLSGAEVPAVVEQLARFRTQRLQPSLLRRRGLPLAVAALALDDDVEIVDLDDPRVLVRERLRPSVVATRQRPVTQPQARALHDKHPRAAGLRWWSTFEASWVNYTLFDRVVPRLTVVSVRALPLDDDAVVAAADYLGLRR